MSSSLNQTLKQAARQVGRLDASWLVCHVCRMNQAGLITESERPLTDVELERIHHLVQRRLAGEPLAYILGEAAFYGRMFTVTPAVLVPRPETEELVGHALSWLADFPPCPRVLDLGTGSGAIAVTLALERPDALVVATDISADALMVARSNAARLGARVDWRQGDWFKAVRDDLSFDLIVSNPPYIAGDDPHLAGDGVCVEPPLALTDGADGLSCLHTIISTAAGYLREGGGLLLEHGYDQGAACRNLLSTAGFQDVLTWQDMSGNERISGGRGLPSPPSRKGVGTASVLRLFANSLDRMP